MGSAGPEVDERPAFPEDARAAANLLLLVPSMESVSREACADLLGTADPDGTDLLLVELVRPADARLEEVRQHSGGRLPAKVGVVAAGEATRSAAAADVAEFQSDDSRVVLTTVGEAGDLTGLGMKASKCLSSWEDDGNRIVLCFDSLTTLLQYADLQRVFQFLHVLTTRVESVDGRAHYHLDPGTCDEQTIATLRGLFDAVVEFEDGEWTAH